MQAERVAQVKKQDGSLWHAYRRGSSTGSGKSTDIGPQEPRPDANWDLLRSPASPERRPKRFRPRYVDVRARRVASRSRETGRRRADARRGVRLPRNGARPHVAVYGCDRQALGDYGAVLPVALESVGELVGELWRAGCALSTLKGRAACARDAPHKEHNSPTQD